MFLRREAHGEAFKGCSGMIDECLRTIAGPFLDRFSADPEPTLRGHRVVEGDNQAAAGLVAQWHTVRKYDKSRHVSLS